MQHQFQYTDFLGLRDNRSIFTMQWLIRAGVASVLCYLLISIAFAQSFFSGTSGTNFNATPHQTTPKAQPSPVLAPGEYQAQVNTLHQQMMESAQSRFQQQYKTATTYVANNVNGGQSEGMASPGTNNAIPPPPQHMMPMTPPPVTSSGSGISTTNEPASAGSVNAPSATAPNQPSQTNTYTGFGGGNNSKPPSSAPVNNAGGGWNIKY